MDGDDAGEGGDERSGRWERRTRLTKVINTMIHLHKYGISNLD